MNRIGIYTLVAPSPQSGVGRWLAGLINGLGQIDHYNQYLLFDSQQQLFSKYAPNRNFMSISLPISARTRWRNHAYQAFFLPFAAAHHNLDVLHIPNILPHFYQLRPTIFTVYDLAEYALSRRVYEPGRHWYRRLASRLVARSATKIITTSENTKRDLVGFLGVDPKKVRVIYPGVDPQFEPLNLTDDQQQFLRQKYRLPGRYILYVGKIQPRKNIPRLLQALQSVRCNHNLPDLKLVIVGIRAWMATEVDRTLEQLELEDAVCFTGFVDDEDLPALYNMAETLVYPSLYEGFGFPIVEAMACGLPVITSSQSSLGEVAGDAAILVEPDDVESIAQAIASCWRDPNLRAQLSHKGLKHAQQFTWNQCAQQTLSLYKEVAA